MKHHLPEEWLQYLDGEAPAPLAASLADHLAVCPECAAEFAAWKRSTQMLRQWEFPKTRRSSRSAPVFTYAKLALAAGIALFIGLAVGRFSAPNANELRQSIAAQLREEMRGEVQKQLVVARRDMDQQRRQDQTQMITYVNGVRDQNLHDCLLLRRDLETAVSVADTDLRVNSRHIKELAEAVAINQP